MLAAPHDEDDLEFVLYIDIVLIVYMFFKVDMRR